MLFDYDGTLTPIVARPEDAVLADDVRRLLELLTGNPRFVVGIVSGRSLDDLGRLAALPGMIHAGNHGMEIRGLGMDFRHPEAAAARCILDDVAATLERELLDIPGCIVEHKGLTLTVHYRQVPVDRSAAVEARVQSCVRQVEEEGQLRLTQGKMVIEVRPDILWDKGTAIQKIWRACGDQPYPVYFGDDLTDEDGFRAVQALGGMAVFVGLPRQGTVAPYQVESPAEVAEVLRLITSDAEG